MKVEHAPDMTTLRLDEDFSGAIPTPCVSKLVSGDYIQHGNRAKHAEVAHIDAATPVANQQEGHIIYACNV